MKQHYERMMEMGATLESEKSLLYQTLEEFEKRGFTCAQAGHFAELLKTATGDCVQAAPFKAYRSES